MSSTNYKAFCLQKFLNENTYYHPFFKTIIIEKGDIIYQPSTTTLHIYYIIEGAVSLGEYNSDGSCVTYDILGDNNVFGNLNYLDSGHFYEFSKALTKSTLLKIEHQFFRDIIIKDHLISDWFKYYLVKRWCIAEKKLALVNQRSILKKIEQICKIYFQKVTIDQIQSDYLPVLLTMQELGDLIGVSRQSISSTLKQKSLNVIIDNIEQNGDHIKI